MCQWCSGVTIHMNPQSLCLQENKKKYLGKYLSLHYKGLRRVLKMHVELK